MFSHWLVVAALFAALATFLSCDADPILMLLSVPKEGAFRGQVVWITGASSGIGAALAVRLAKAGAQVVLSARRIEQLNAVSEVCVAQGSSYQPLVLPLDVTNADAQADAVARVLGKFGRIDMLVLNAGKSQRVVNYNLSTTALRDIVELNFFSVVQMTQLVLPAMIKQHAGHLVLMSSVSGKFGTPLAAGYSASKFALHGYFEAVRAEMEVLNNISVSIVCPGPVESEIGMHAHKDPTLPPPNEGQKMSADRAATLMLRGLYHRLPEVWVIYQPILLLTYLCEYMPALYRRLSVHLVGPLRIRALREGSNVMDVWRILGMKK